MNPLSRTIVLPLAALALSVSLAACGDDETEPTSSTPTTTSTSATTDETSDAGATITKDEYVEQAGGRCGQLDTLIDSTVAEVGPEGEEAIQQAGAETVAPAYEQHLADLRALGYPEGDEATLEAIYAQQEELVAAFASDMVGVLDGGYADLVASIATAYDDYGVLACGTAPGTEGEGLAGDGTEGAGEALGHDDFVAQANALCADYAGYLAEEGAKVDGSNESVQTYVLDVVVPTLRDEAIAFEQLGFPAGDEDALQAIVDAQNALADEYEADPVADDGSSGDDLNALLTDFGLTDCVA